MYHLSLQIGRFPRDKLTEWVSLLGFTCSFSPKRLKTESSAPFTVCRIQKEDLRAWIYSTSWYFLSMHTQSYSSIPTLIRLSIIVSRIKFSSLFTKIMLAREKLYFTQPLLSLKHLEAKYIPLRYVLQASVFVLRSPCKQHRRCLSLPSLCAAWVDLRKKEFCLIFSHVFLFSWGIWLPFANCTQNAVICLAGKVSYTFRAILKVQLRPCSPEKLNPVLQHVG